jgi:F0F1-type ATP synthase assembly protein I
MPPGSHGVSLGGAEAIPGGTLSQKGSLSSRRLIMLALALAIVAAAALVVTSPSSVYDVKEEGRDLLPYETGEVYRVEVLGTLTVYADGESRPSPSLIQGSLLVVLATAAFMTFFFLRRLAARREVVQFYLVASAGLAFLALDELFALHETVGHNLRFLADLPGVKRPDDVIVLLYLIPLAYCAYRFRGVIVESPRALKLFAVGIGFFLLAAFADLASSGVEEGLELISLVGILAGLVTLFLRHVTEAEQPYRREDEIRAARLRAEQPVGASRVT